MSVDMIAATRRELERWPGTKASFSNGGKHIIATLEYEGRSRMVVCAKTLSDNARGGKNHIAEVRRELLALGAARIATPKSTSPKRQRNKAVRRAVPVERAPVIGNGFDKLAGVKLAAPRLSRAQRALAWLKGLWS